MNWKAYLFAAISLFCWLIAMPIYHLWLRFLVEARSFNAWLMLLILPSVIAISILLYMNTAWFDNYKIHLGWVALGCLFGIPLSILGIILGYWIGVSFLIVPSMVLALYLVSWHAGKI